MKLIRKRAKPITLSDVTIIDDSKLRQAITAACLGNAMEWFDFGVYGYVANALGKVFFPNASPGTQLVATLATFSVPFLIRPIGGAFFGRLGDKYGRQMILAITIVIMSISTFCIGLIPSYAHIGIWAPILLLICKMAQGFSVGGEYTGASIFVAEYSPDRKRGFLGSFIDFGAVAGFLLGAGVVMLISTIFGQQALNTWAWRLPFFLALPLGMVGLYLRHALEETPAFQQHVEKLEQGDREGLQNGPRISLKTIFTKYWRSFLVCVGLVISTNVNLYMLLTYMPSYLSHSLHYSEDQGVLIILVVMIAILLVQPLIGFLSDRIGRRPFVLLGSLGMFLLAIPAFELINSGMTGLIFLGLLILAVILNCFTGVQAASVPAMFPTSVRYSALAAAFNVSIIICGLTPTVVAWLVNVSSDLMMPAYYLMAASLIGLLTWWNMRETANKPLRGAAPAASDMKEARELLREHHDGIEQKIEALDEEIKKIEAQRSRLIDQHPRINE